jgi:hypothetical protein
MPKRIRGLLMGLAALAALALGGSAIAGAASNTSTTTTSTTAAPPANGAGVNGPPGAGPGFSAADAPGTAAHENAEKAVSGPDAEKAQAAAIASVGSGKAGSVTTDFRGSGYEVTVTKADGSQVPVHLDSSFKVQTHPGGPGPGMGALGGHPPLAGQGPPPGQAPPAA